MSFTGDLKRFSVKSVERVNEVKRAVSLELFSSVIRDTPVDTGRARGNWQTNTGAPIKSVVERDDVSGGAATKEAERVVGQSNLADALYMTNNLPYIEPLENGNSRQPPKAMVKRNFARIKRIIERSVRR